MSAVQSESAERSALFSSVLDVCKQASGEIELIDDKREDEAIAVFRELRNSAHETKSRAFSLIERFPAAKHDLELVIRALDDVVVHTLDAEHEALNAERSA